MLTSFQEQSNFSAINEFHPIFRLIFSFEQGKVKLLLNLIYFSSQLSNHRVLLFLKKHYQFHIMLKALQLSHFLSSCPFNNLLSDNGSQSGAVSPRSRVDALQATSSGYQTSFRIPEGERLRECRLYNCMISCTAKLFKGAD